MSDNTGLVDEWLQFEEKPGEDRVGREQFPLQWACDGESSEKSDRLEFADVFKDKWEGGDDKSWDR